MLFETLAGAGLITYIGTKLAQEKRHEPKLIEILQPTQPQPIIPHSPAKPSTVSKLRTKMDDKYQEFVQRHIDPLFGTKRHDLLQEISASNIDFREQEMNRMVGMATANLAWASFCSLFAPQLLVTSGIALVYMFYRGPLQWAYQAVVKERKINVAFLDAVFISWAILARYFFVGSMGAFLGLSVYKVIARIKHNSQQRLVDVFSQHPRFVWLIRDGVEVQVPFEQLKVGDTFVVQAGEVIPADGRIVQGLATIDQHALTGESQPAEKQVNDSVLASTTVLSGKLYVEVTEAGSDTVAAKIGQLLNQTTDHKTHLELRALKLVDQTVLPTLALSLLAYPLVGTTGALAVLSASLGYSMRFLAPLSTLSFLQVTSDNSILVKDGRAFEVLPEIDTIVFDKTGTLTQEQPLVSHLHPLNGYNPTTLLTYAAAAEHRQTHPIAKAILQAAEEHDLAIPQIDEAQYEIGYGIKVQLDGKIIRVGSHRFIQAEAVAIPPQIQQIHDQCQHAGHSLVLVAVDDHLAGAIELQPTIRPEAKQVISQLHQQGLKTIIISGDQEAPTQNLAQQLGIDDYFANTLPEQKANLIKALQVEGRKVCFIGDGINDSIALRQADVAISLRGATTAAIDTAQIILMDEQLAKLPQLIEISHRFERNQKNNFILSIIPSALCVGGVFILHTGIYFAYLVYYSGLFLGVGNATRPLLEANSTQRESD